MGVAACIIRRRFDAARPPGRRRHRVGRGLWRGGNLLRRLGSVPAVLLRSLVIKGRGWAVPRESRHLSVTRLAQRWPDLAHFAPALPQPGQPRQPGVGITGPACR